MGQLISCESDEVSCSSAFATCRTQHCSSSCMKRVKAVEDALVPLEIVAQNAAKKYIEDNIHIFMQNHLPTALAAHFESVAESVFEAVIVPPDNATAPDALVPVVPHA